MTEAAKHNPTNEPQEYIAFHIGDQTYCIDIMAVREIRGWTQATPLPYAPGFVNGVINLRGAVLPVVDLAARLGLPRSEHSARQVIVVVQHMGQIAGLLVDAVSDILMLTPESIQPTPDVASELSRTFIKGVVAAEEKLISVLVLKNLLPDSTEAAA